MKMTASTSGIFLCLSVLLLFACSSVVVSYQPNPLSMDRTFECVGREEDQECANYAQRLKKDDGRTRQSHGEGDHSCNITPTKHQDAVNVNFEMVDNGEYVLKIKMINPCSTDEDEIQRAKHMAQNGAMLLLYGKMLQDMGKKMTAQSQASIYSKFNMPTDSS